MFIRLPKDISALVRSTRIAQGLKQQELADRLGVSRWWINELERGKVTARMDLILRTLNELDITLIAQVGTEVTDTGTSRTPESIIDIDAISDTGLEISNTPTKTTERRKR